MWTGFCLPSDVTLIQYYLSIQLPQVYVDSSWYSCL